MLTTAIASVITSAAVAQTSITGELRINYKTIEAPKGLGNTTTPNTAYGFGAEQQINFANKGKLNVGGLDYAAGFSIENDGEQTGTLFNENVYMDFTNASSGTTISFGRDHIQRSDSDFSATNLVGFSPNELTQTTNATNGGTWFAQNLGPAASQSYGIALLQNTPVGRFSYNFVPNNAKASGAAANSSANSLTVTGGTANSDRTTVVDGDTVATAGSEAVNPNTTSAYEYGFVGNLGVTGLQAHYFKSKNNDFTMTWTNGAVSAEAKNYGVRYNFGQFSAGANKKVYNAEAATLTETTETAYAAAYAVNKDLSIGVIKAKADRSTSGIDHTVKGINLGYNLGPVALAAGYAKSSDASGSTGADNDVFMIRLLGAF